MSKIDSNKNAARIGFMTYLSDRGGVGHIRTILPSLVLGAWRYNKIVFDPIYMSNFIPDPHFYQNLSFVKFQRSATKDQLQMIKHFKSKISKQTSTPIIYEIDDLLFDIPKSNFASQYFKENEKYIEEMLRIVDGITVSTGTLKQSYKKYNKNISIVRNRLSKALWGNIKDYEYDDTYKKLRIIYPGSQNHFSQTGNGGDIGNELLKYIKDTKKDKFEWIFIGGIPHELKDDKDILYYPWFDYLTYPHFLKNLYADIAIAPLEINKFNSCKSDLKMLEYVLCGFPAVYTNIDPYKKASLTSNTEFDMINHIESLANNIDLRYEISKKDKNTMKNVMFLEENRKKWINEHLKLFKKELK